MSKSNSKNLNEIVRYFTFELVNLPQLQSYKCDEELKKFDNLDRFIKLYFNESDISNSTQIYTSYQLEEAKVPLRIIQGSEIINNFHARDKTEIFQLLFIQLIDDISNLQEEFLTYLQSRFVSLSPIIIILSQSNAIHGQERDRTTIDFDNGFFKYYSSKFKFIFVNINSDKKVSQIEEAINSGIKSMYLQRKRVQDNNQKFKELNEKQTSHVEKLDKWTEKDIIVNMSTMPNTHKQLSQKDIQYYYNMSAQDFKNLDLEKKSSAHQQKIKASMPTPLKKHGQNEFEENQLKKREKGAVVKLTKKNFEKEDELFLRKKAFDSALVEDPKIFNYLSLNFGNDIPDEIKQDFEKQKSFFKSSLNLLLKQVQERNLKQLSQEDLYACKLPEDKRDQIIYRNDSKALEFTNVDFTTAKCLALAQILTPNDKLRIYLNLLYGQPKDSLNQKFIANMTNLIESYIPKYKEQLKSLSEDNITRKNLRIKHYYSEHVTGIQVSMNQVEEIKNNPDALAIDLNTAKLLAFNQVLLPNKNLRNYLNLLLGRPKDGIIVNSMMKKIEELIPIYQELYEETLTQILKSKKICVYSKIQMYRSQELSSQLQLQNSESSENYSKEDNFAYIHICYDYFNKAIISYIENEQDLLSNSKQSIENIINSDSIITAIFADKSTLLKFGYPPEQYQQNIKNQMKEILDHKIKTWKSSLTFYNTEIKKRKKEKQFSENQLSFQRSEQIYFEFGQLFVGGFKLVGLKMLSCQKDQYSKEICDSLERVKTLKVFKQTKFNLKIGYRTFDSFQQIVNNENDQSELINTSHSKQQEGQEPQKDVNLQNLKEDISEHNYSFELSTNHIDDNSNFFISFVNLSDENSSQQFLNFTRYNFEVKKNISHIIVFIFDGEKKVKGHDEILDWQENISSRVKKIWINKSIIHKWDIINLIKEKIEDVIVDRIKDQGFLKLVLFDLFSDFTYLQKEIKKQHENPSRGDVEDMFYDYVNSKCQNGFIFDRSYLLEIFGSILEPIQFEALQIENIVQLFIHEDNYITKKISQNEDAQMKIISLQIIADEAQVQGNINFKEQYQLALNIQQQIFTTKFKKFNTNNQVPWNETIYTKGREDEEVTVQLVRFSDRNVVYQNKMSFQYIVKSNEIELFSTDVDHKRAKIKMKNSFIDFYKEKENQNLPLWEFVKRKFELQKLLIPKNQVNNMAEFTEIMKQSNQLGKQNTITQNTSPQEDLKSLQSKQEKLKNLILLLEKYNLQQLNEELILNYKSINDFATKIQQSIVKINKKQSKPELWTLAQQFKQNLTKLLNTYKESSKKSVQSRNKEEKEKQKEMNNYKVEKIHLKNEIEELMQKKRELEERGSEHVKRVLQLKNEQEKQQEKIMKNEEQIAEKQQEYDSRAEQMEKLEQEIEEKIKNKNQKMSERVSSQHPPYINKSMPNQSIRNEQQEKNDIQNIIQQLQGQQNSLEKKLFDLKRQIENFKSENERMKKSCEEIENQIKQNFKNNFDDENQQQEIKQYDEQIKEKKAKLDILPGKQLYEEHNIVYKQVKGLKKVKTQKYDKLIRQTIEDVDELIRLLEKAKQALEQKLSEIESKISKMEEEKWVKKKKEQIQKKDNFLDQKNLNEEQKKKIQDYQSEFMRSITMHYLKAITLLNDVFEVKKSTTEVVLQKLGDLLPIPFFKSVMTIVSGCYKLNKTIKEMVQKRQLEVYSEIFPTIQLQSQVAEEIMKLLVNERKYLILQTSDIEKGYLARVMDTLQEKFADEEFYRKIDNGAKQMAHLDALAFISITLRWCSELLCPEERDLKDYTNMKWKKKLILEKMLNLQAKELFENVQGLDFTLSLKDIKKKAISQSVNKYTSSQSTNNTLQQSSVTQFGTSSKVHPLGNPKQQKNSFLSSLFSCFKNNKK